MKLKECCTLLVDGDWIESKDQSPEGIRLVQTGNIGNGKYLEKASRAKYISKETFERLGCTEIFPGDILISRLPEPVGRACLIPDKHERMITAVDCSILRVDENVVHKRYLLHFLKSNSYFNQLAGKLAGTTRTRVSRKNLEQVQVPIPNMDKQQYVVSVLDRIIDIIDARTQQLTELDTLVKARFVEMFGDPLLDNARHPRVALGSVAEVGSSKRIFEKEYVSDGVPFYRTKEIVELSKGSKISTELFITRERYNEIRREYGVPQAGDLLISAVGTIGIIWIVDGKNDFYFKDGNLLRIGLSQNFNPIYLKVLLEALIGAYKQEMSSGTAYAALTISALKEMLVYEVPIKEQEQFSAFVTQVNQTKSVVQKALDEAQTLFDSLMQQYFG